MRLYQALPTILRAVAQGTSDSLHIFTLGLLVCGYTLALLWIACRPANGREPMLRGIPWHMPLDANLARLRDAARREMRRALKLCCLAIGLPFGVLAILISIADHASPRVAVLACLATSGGTFLVTSLLICLMVGARYLAARKRLRVNSEWAERLG